MYATLFYAKHRLHRPEIFARYSQYLHHGFVIILTLHDRLECMRHYFVRSTVLDRALFVIVFLHRTPTTDYRIIFELRAKTFGKMSTREFIRHSLVRSVLHFYIFNNNSMLLLTTDYRIIFEFRAKSMCLSISQSVRGSWYKFAGNGTGTFLGSVGRF